MEIRFLGGVRTVTGACYYLSIDGIQMLIDCGIYQGENSDMINRAPFDFDASTIDYLFLTHAHIDHSGLIPKLFKEGFKGKIITTSATADLTEIMLYDSAHLQKKDAEWLTKKAFRAGKDFIYEPLYTPDDIKAVIPLFERVSYGEQRFLNKRLLCRFVDAGHILGSSTVEIIYQRGTEEKRVVFSGDIGKKGNPIINDPYYLGFADYIVMESTYGNRLHKNMQDTINEFVKAIKETFDRGGNVLIPAFAVGRTQDILYIMNKLIREGQLSEVDVYVDSPLAEAATKVYINHPECFDEETLVMLKEGKRGGIKLNFAESVEDSQRINNIKSGAVIIAGSGMCEGGRIRHHLKHNLWRSECSIIFTGFQAQGTLGRKIVDGAEAVKVLGEEIAVKAKVYTIGGFSAHADQKELLEWLGAFSNSPKVFIVHGEENVSLEFERIVRERFGYQTYVPKKGDAFEL
ncbi:MAG: MBL fold metallo-hydrolase [Thermodesulfovibrionales bacterium]|nr:MBL fold metallo-hydrolase [Thermodesulfovibrionales bacterium]